MKWRKISRPPSVCSTSGWNWTPQMGRVGWAIAWTGQDAEWASVAQPAGGTITWSLWFDQTLSW